jgi:ATP-dependent RNA helicase DeaD
MLEVLTGLGFEQPTPIQAAAIPPLLEGRDVIGRARTGTGKTAAFGLPLITRLPATRTRAGLPQALVLAPTRELALQVTEALKTFTADALRIVTVYGGAPYGAQLRALRDGVEVVVGTPGRIIDLLERKSLVLSEIKLLVLDEADEMLKMGFIEDVERVLADTPPQRQVALFSATMPDPIRRVAERWLKTPVEAADAKGVSVPEIAQKYLVVPSRNKREALLRVLQGEPRGAAIVFAATKIQCAEIADELQRSGFQAEALHGDLSQPARERVIQQLREKRLDLVVATDIAARGIDIDHLTHIINVDLPKNLEVYTHRIGRTGRAGRKGTAITFVVPRDVGPFLQALGRQGAKLTELFLPSEAELISRRREALTDELRAWVSPATEDAPVAPEPAEARRWVGQLVANGWELEDLATAALGMFAKERFISLDPNPDRGVPPWARQSGVDNRPKAKPTRPEAPEARPTKPTRSEPARPAKHETSEFEAPVKKPRALPDAALLEAEMSGPEEVAEVRPAKKRAARDPEAQAPDAGHEAWVHIGVGRNHGVRPSDIVGALANELGLPGASIGRIELRDTSTLVQVVPEFAERLGDGAWPISVRRIETEVKLSDRPAPPRRPPPSHLKHAAHRDAPQYNRPQRGGPPSDRPYRDDRGAPPSDRSYRDDRGGPPSDRPDRSYRDDRGAARPDGDRPNRYGRAPYADSFAPRTGQSQRPDPRAERPARGPRPEAPKPHRKGPSADRPPRRQK